MPHIPLRQLRPELFENEFETDSDDDDSTADDYASMESTSKFMTSAEGY